MRFVDRTVEGARLDALVPPGLGVLWGRRRVGKTRLLVEWCRRTGGLYTVADASAEPVQRRYLAEAVAERVPGFADVTYPDWRAWLRALAREASRGALGGPLVIDEVPYLVASSPPLASLLQAFVDHEAREAGLVLVLAGSSRHMMHGLALEADAPLFGRARVAFEVLPLPAGWLGEALGLDRPEDVLESHAAWGGIPWYWELAQPFGRRLEAAVDGLVLDPAGPLHHEPDRLLTDEQPGAAALRPLLDVIGAGASRVSEIAGRVGWPATSLGRPLGRLVELGLVRREIPFGESERTGRRSLYRIADPFLRLWFRVVAPRRGLLVAAPPAARLAVWRRARSALLSEAWEELCRRAVPLLGERLGTAFGPAARWWRGEAPEWDVVAESLDGSAVLLGECKWSAKPPDARTLARWRGELLAKGVPEVPGVVGRRVVHVQFVSRRPSGRRPGDPCVVIDARDVLGVLR